MEDHETELREMLVTDDGELGKLKFSQKKAKVLIGVNQMAMVAVFVLVGLVTFAACIIVTVAISRDRTGTAGGTSVSTDGGANSAVSGVHHRRDKRVYTIMVGDDYGAYQYIDEGGFMTGFQYDLIYEVCEVVGIDCRTVRDAYTNCWDSEPGKHPFGGEGLMDRWYYACAGYFGSTARKHVFDFSEPFIHAPKAYFFTKKGAAGNFDTSDITGKTIGFIVGWAIDEMCLARQKDLRGNTLPVDKVVYVTSPKDLADKIKSGEVDAGFTSKVSLEQWVNDGDIEPLDRSFDCLLTGGAMMTRKDSRFNALWDMGFQNLRSSGRFKKLCEEGQERHGHKGTIDYIL